jgi:hypothetical protein
MSWLNMGMKHAGDGIRTSDREVRKVIRDKGVLIMAG